MSGFFGNIMNQAVGALGGQLGDKIGEHFGDFIRGNGLQMLLSQASKVGLQDKVQSWIGNGENLPISADELRSLLSNEQINAILEKTGLPVGTVLPLIAQVLPNLVDKHTPEGTVPSA
ncbi:YidB family protein [Swingsia samuiensis]|uniref:DUF937 domain-containing protein n=1 Tax=Swingsia samuiensis TaxID=1293412 RepID=A0A4Y6UG13_9PROT|nr:YidB family protein [Swingsia samuiensis]QDH16503.1 DUF937 domain-containing protein [Swingsia samuiensis]